MFGRVSQCLDGWGVEELGEDEGAWGRGSLDYEVGGGAGRIGRLAEGQKGLEGVESACLLHDGREEEDLMAGLDAERCCWSECKKDGRHLVSLCAVEDGSRRDRGLGGEKLLP